MVMHNNNKVNCSWAKRCSALFIWRTLGGTRLLTRLRETRQMWITGTDSNSCDQTTWNENIRRIKWGERRGQKTHRSNRRRASEGWNCCSQTALTGVEEIWTWSRYVWGIDERNARKLSGKMPIQWPPRLPAFPEALYFIQIVLLLQSMDSRWLRYHISFRGTSVENNYSAVYNVVLT